MKKLTFTICFLVFLFSGNILFAGYTITQLTDNTVGYFYPQINDHGYVVWQERPNSNSYSKIHLFDGSTVTQISDDNVTHNVIPSINNNGHVVWSGWSPGHDIYLYDGNNTAKFELSGDFAVADVFPHINNNGDIVWESFEGYDHNLYLYNGTTKILITTSICSNDMYLVEEEYHYIPRLNDNGYIAWQQWDGSDYEIFLYNGSDITQLTDNTSDDRAPRINNNGTVVWSGQVADNIWVIYQYDGNHITELIRNEQQGIYTPNINDNGYFAWSAFETGEDWYDSETFLYNGCTIAQITDNQSHDSDPYINNNGKIVWSGYVGDVYKIFLASPDLSDSILGCGVSFPWLMLLLGD